MNKKNIRISIAVSIVIVASLFLLNLPIKNSDNILVEVKKGVFIVDVITTGELEAKHSVEIQGPKGLRAHRIWQVTIQDMIDEGTKKIVQEELQQNRIELSAEHAKEVHALKQEGRAELRTYEQALYTDCPTKTF